MLTVKFLTYLVSCGIFLCGFLFVSMMICNDKVKIVRVLCFAVYFGLGGLVLGQNKIIALTMTVVGVVLGALSSNKSSDENILGELNRELGRRGWKLEEFSKIIANLSLSSKSKKVILTQIREEIKKAAWFRERGQDLQVYHIFSDYPENPMTTFLTAVNAVDTDKVRK